MAIVIAVVPFLIGQGRELTNPEIAQLHPEHFWFSTFGAVVLTITFFATVTWLSNWLASLPQYESVIDAGNIWFYWGLQAFCFVLLVLHYLRWCVGETEANFSAIHFIVSVVIVGIAFFVNSLIYRSFLRSNWGPQTVSFSAVGIGLCLFLFGFLTNTLGGVEVAAAVGAQGFVFAWLAALMLIVSGLQYLADRVQSPLILLIVLVLGGQSYFSFHSNHQIRRLAGTTGDEKIAKLDLSDAFADWLGCRPNFQSIEGGAGHSYPVFIVAAEGGGAYAAAHAGMTLARLQAENPAFVDHVFAISSVSGGSVGAAAFISALMDGSEGKNSDTCGRGLASQLSGPKIEGQVRAFSGYDLFSPLIVGSLYRGTLQRIIPIPSLDPARSFELALEAGWQSSAHKPRGLQSSIDKRTNPFQRDFYKLWNATSGFPALILNTTSSQYGVPVQISAFTRVGTGKNPRNIVGSGQIQFIPFASLIKHDKFNASSRISLSTAVGLSARFPYFFPPATTSDEPLRNVGLEYVDGGYYDNTGINAAAYFRDVLRARRDHILQKALSATGKRLNFEIYLLLIGSYAERFERQQSGIYRSLRTPIEAISDTRIARTVNSRSFVRRRRMPNVTFRLNQDGKKFPLGFQLAPSTIVEIGERIGRKGMCTVHGSELIASSTKDAATVIGSKSETIRHNSCSQKTVSAILNSYSTADQPYLH